MKFNYYNCVNNTINTTYVSLNDLISMWYELRKLTRYQNTPIKSMYNEFKHCVCYVLLVNSVANNNESEVIKN